MGNPSEAIRYWTVRVSGAVAMGTLAYLGSHAFPQHVRETGSAILATVSGSLWALSALLPLKSLVGRGLGMAAAALAALSGVFLMP